ncbi:pyruvate dehydrogenase (acetyl-transferring), homodimeric type [Jonesia denitrificans]|uniref:Pyruvate dehydrogenase E1 component n=1 Tax=Jonesia denitrificans (strain ATCC 14870 / DSM 20603 / BCRC 15368 / CIP 55.134 / JCM 11481 / NBRC 15587 / NCTC 10816 / Prevot 55134) TaxID=471856 RepID=C7R4Z0_JONDD|nr:pyruvate dehydrogenase (acetyl-transferring), homodimeric type [Jonesia denitrificans]ACV09160.1 2-oxo-acid dehydrogenase E1 subunit, homodimeric type [Jonesia denitrificans DSM 20603]ASE09562.1 pyruvate dehydrogenase (acetyl-transferring), homodimeric type [Jonesia denitrificans]QXB44107.1 pyruvate dehydrogenase (acetyl-transferring), homodimeric type [Jonesia denitrificans]SQH21387.1 Pyruvate dehydrogenase E1 component [Jonesia denitrificans]
MAANEQTGPLINGLLSQVPDIDPTETGEWIESLDGLIDEAGGPRARYILLNLLKRARERNVAIPTSINTPYVNTIGVHEEPYFPGDEVMERKYRSWVRWNAAVLVTRAQRPEISVGGHISSYASVATLYEVGLNHFFRGKDHPGGGDQIFFQGHASPGVYARAFLEGRLSAERLDGFRQEHSLGAGNGLPSYPHPRQMPEFWEFPTVSMGLGPAEAIYQAWTNKYLHNRGIKDTSQQDVWAFLGDGEMDEPESRGMIQLATQQQLDNLTFVVNCNLQRLDGPVRGNGKIIQELEAQFKGAGWNVIKVVWGREWDTLLNADKDRALVNLMNTTPDGDYQTYKANDGAFVREHFFGRDPRTKKLVENMSDDEIWALKRGGHDYRKLFAAYAAARSHTGQPTVILAKTIKGYGLGSGFAGRNATHQKKKVGLEELKTLRDTLHIPITDEQLEANPYLPPYYHPGMDDPAIEYMLDRRRQLGGFVPERRNKHVAVSLPGDKAYEVLAKGSGKQEVASTMAFVRLLKELMKDKEFGHRVVPIIPDEARTFGLDAIFPTAKIFNTLGQNYLAVDRDLMLSYKESESGQIMHTGINEAGSAAAFQTVGTSYATHGEPLVPFYIFYSMFGFQRTGDQFWAAGDQLTRGFIIGATAGRTTLTGEGTQHADGHSPLLAGTNTAVVQYDPAYGYEIRHIVRDGLKRMYDESDPRDPNIMYYLTVYNEPMPQPAEPDNVDVDGILRGIHRVSVGQGDGPRVQLLASGVGVPWALEAQELLANDWGVAADVWSVTSWNELRRDGLAADQHNFLHPDQEPREAYLTQKLKDAQGPFIATSDYDHLVQDQVRTWIPGDYAVLGADGFGFSDTRAAARRYFKIDGPSVVVRALQELARRGEVSRDLQAQAITKYDLHNVAAGTSGSVGGDA